MVKSNSHEFESSVENTPRRVSQDSIDLAPPTSNTIGKSDPSPLSKFSPNRKQVPSQFARGQIQQTDKAKLQECNIHEHALSVSSTRLSALVAIR